MEGHGIQFDPRVVEAFGACHHKFALTSGLLRDTGSVGEAVR
jgi:HD-GYP domain-containing protein (c-di-GMP phosphodiesterase class II)